MPSSIYTDALHTYKSVNNQLTTLAVHAWRAKWRRSRLDNHSISVVAKVVHGLDHHQNATEKFSIEFSGFAIFMAKHSWPCSFAPKAHIPRHRHPREDDGEDVGVVELRA